MADLIHQFNLTFGVWNMTRIAGLVSYGLLSVSMVFGILQSYGDITTKTKSTFYKIHETTSWFGLLIGILHGFVLVFDTYVGYSWIELLVPFTDSNQPFLSGLGTLSLYLMLFLILTSDLRNKIKKKTWKMIHYLSFVTFVTASIHGIFQGTDSKFNFIQLMYLIIGATIMVLIIIRPRKSPITR